MNRIAIGYSPNPSEQNRAVVVFVETNAGIQVLRRGEPAGAFLVDRAVTTAGEMIEPGSDRYFDAVLDAFSSSTVIRTVAQLDPTMLTTLLAEESSWEALPRPQQSAVGV